MDIDGKIEYLLVREKKVLKNFLTQKEFEDWHLSTLSTINADLGFLTLAKGDKDLSKQYFYNAGLIDVFLTENYKKTHSRFLDFDINRCLIPLLSDHDMLITNYSKVRYNCSYIDEASQELVSLSMDEQVLKGEMAAMTNTIQMFMANDRTGIERNLSIIETLVLPKLSSKDKELYNDYCFYRAVYNGNASEAAKALEKIMLSSFQNKRNKYALEGNQISMPVLGYAKLSRRLGVNIDLQFSGLPHNFLPIKPLPTYAMPYDFLRGTVV